MQANATPLKTLFLQAPSYDGFDGGAGSRYQAKREIRSFWYPTWLAQPAALVPGSRVLDAPADDLSVAQTLEIAADYELVIIHTSTPSFPTDAAFAQDLKQRNPSVLIGMVGAKVAVDPHNSLVASNAIDFVCREEFDYTCRDVAERKPFADILGLSYRTADGAIEHNGARPMIEDMDALPFVAPVYQRDLKIDNYFIGYLNYPYVSIYTGRGCKSRCTFCLWPQTVSGHRYRTRSVENVLAEAKWIRDNMPEVKELMFDDDTFTDDLPRAEAIAIGLGKLGMTWSCNAKANVPYKTLKIMKENGLRLLLVGYESGDDQILVNIKKGVRTDFARRFSADCKKLGIKIHGTFILGLPGETQGHHSQNHRIREGNQSAHDPGLAGRAVSGHAALRAGDRERLDGREQDHQPGQQGRRAARRDRLSAPVEGRDLPRARALLSSRSTSGRRRSGRSCARCWGAGT